MEEKIYLNVPFEEKDQVKALGAKWDWDEKKWYFTDENKRDLFLPWLPKPSLNLDDLSDEQKIEVRNKLCDWYKKRELPDDDLFDFIVWITSRYGECEFLSHCETCGDNIYTTTLEI
jgi:hypothetical protein